MKPFIVLLFLLAIPSISTAMVSTSMSHSKTALYSTDSLFVDGKNPCRGVCQKLENGKPIMHCDKRDCYCTEADFQHGNIYIPYDKKMTVSIGPGLRCYLLPITHKRENKFMIRGFPETRMDRA
jgi:hypothetical protein